jgi:hypothetical protein
VCGGIGSLEASLLHASGVVGPREPQLPPSSTPHGLSYRSPDDTSDQQLGQPAGKDSAEHDEHNPDDLREVDRNLDVFENSHPGSLGRGPAR